MPLKEETETQLLRALSNTPLQVDCTFLMLSTHVSKNTSASHLNKFYVTFESIRRKKFDGIPSSFAFLFFDELDVVSLLMRYAVLEVTEPDA